MPFEQVAVFTRACPSKSLSKDTLKISECQTSIRIAQDVAHSKSSTQTMKFTHCFSSKSTNLDLASKFYPEICQAIQQGTNLTVFAYGAKSTGKSHSLFGVPSSTSSEKGTIHHLLHLLMSTSQQQYMVSASHFEIYNESVLDFFALKKRFLRVTENKDTGLAFIQGLSTAPVNTAEECIQMIDSASGLRKTRPQAHAVFQLEFKSSLHQQTSTIRFVDLCASNERSMQNFSLEEMDASLRHLMSACFDIVDFRKSILTWLFQDSFNSGVSKTKTLVLACLSCENRELGTTQETLKFAQQCQQMCPAYEHEASSLLEFASSSSSSSSSSSCNSSMLSSASAMMVVAAAAAERALSMDSAPEVGEFSYEHYADEEEQAPTRTSTPSKRSTPIAKTSSSFSHARSASEVEMETAAAMREQLKGELREEFEVLEKQIDDIAREAEKDREEAREARAMALEFQCLLAEKEIQVDELHTLLAEKDRQVEKIKLETSGHQEQLEIQALAEHAAAFTIQSMWRRYQRRMTHRQNQKLMDWYQNEIEAYASESAALKGKITLYEELQACCDQLVVRVETLQDEAKQFAQQRLVLEEQIHEQAQAIANMAPAQGIVDELALKTQHLEELNEELNQVKQERDTLQVELQQAHNQVDASESAARRLETKLEAIESEGQNYVDLEAKRLRSEISSLKLQLDVANQNLQAERETAQERINQAKRSSAKLDTELQGKIDMQERKIERLESQLKQKDKAYAEAKESHDRELKDAVAAAVSASNNGQRRSVGESFLFHYKDSRISIAATPAATAGGNALARTRLSAIPMCSAAATSALLPMNEETQLLAAVPEEFLCVKVDVEDCDGRTFRPCESTVSRADSDVRTYHCRAPLFDVRNGRWSRIKIKLLNSSSFPVHAAKGIMLEHLLPRGKSILHHMEIVHTEHSPNGSAIQSLTVQWDSAPEASCIKHRRRGSDKSHMSLSSTSSYEDVEPCSTTTTTSPTHEECFCFSRSQEESGPMVLHAKFHMGERTIHWKFPLRFKNPTGPRFVPAPLKGFFARRNHRACDENKFGYINSSWFPIPQQVNELTDAEPVSNSHRVVLIKGYLQKHQSHMHQKVQRWFVFAPPFLLCYDTVEKAAEDFSPGRALPHGANRALQIDPVRTRLRVLPSKVAGVEQTEFEIATHEKKWTLQAANETDLAHWTESLENWMARERELDAENNAPAAMASLLVGGALDFVPEDDDEEDNEHYHQASINSSYTSDFSAMGHTRTVISPSH